MEIRLKEAEIREAVRAYIATQGINLTGKAVDIKFTATRGDAGIIAEVDITNAAELAVVTTATETPKAEVAADSKPGTRAVGRTATKSEEKTTQEIAKAAMEAPLEEDPAAEAPAEEVAVAQETAAAGKGTSSLFG
jgi:hypothetical protein